MKSKCPRCGGVVRWQVRGARRVAFCACTRSGPVIDAPLDTSPAGVEQPEAWRVFLTIPGVNIEIARTFYAHGWRTLDDIHAISDEELLSIPGIGPIRAARIRGWLVNDEQEEEYDG